MTLKECKRFFRSMIGSGSTLQVTDNSGARLVQCINQSGTTWGIGDVITVAVKKAIKGKVAAGTVSSFPHFPSYLFNNDGDQFYALRLSAQRSTQSYKQDCIRFER
jgi:hypothetical protein